MANIRPRSGGQRFSPLTQINPSNVGQLQVAWVYHMRPAVPAPAPAAVEAGRGAAPDAAGGAAPPQGRGRGRGRGGSGFAVAQTTPLVVDGVMCITTPHGPRCRARSDDRQGSLGLSMPNSVPTSKGVSATGRCEDAAPDRVRQRQWPPLFPARKPVNPTRRSARRASSI